MNILLVEPFFGGSHAAWARGLQAHSRHRIELRTLPDRSWKWRMHGGALTLARAFLAGDFQPDLILASDMLDLTTFLALTRQRTAGIPTVVYFHENQLAYPWSPNDPDPQRGRDRHYGFINLASALAADGVWFNSAHNRDTFLQGCRDLLGRMRDFQETGRVEELGAKAAVVPLGLDLAALDDHCPGESRTGPPLVLWNHRWEHDKNPEAFFQALFTLAERGHAFEVAVLGQRFRSYPAVFDEARERLGERLVHCGYAGSFAEYARWLWRADLQPVTSHHDFFGISVVEAAYCRTRPVLPRRLAYPELIPAVADPDCFYDDEGDLPALLARALETPEWDPEPLRAAMAAYDWERMAPVYDEAFARVRGPAGH